MIIIQHLGDGKAKQLFVCGLNPDHCRDFNISMDEQTHAHAQGYCDIDPMLPELVQRLD